MRSHAESLTASACVVALMSLACGTTATVYRANGPPVEADLVGGTPDSIVLERDGRRAMVPRSEVTDIDHPGNVHILVGGSVLALGTFELVRGLPDCVAAQYGTSPANTFCMQWFVTAAMGTMMIIYGIITYTDSKSAAADTTASASGSAPAAPTGGDRSLRKR